MNKLNTVTKMPNHSADISTPSADVIEPNGIVLAANDINAIQDLNKASKANNASDKVVVEKEGDISRIPPQIWLILAALCCFVLRSNRKGI